MLNWTFEQYIEKFDYLIHKYNNAPTMEARQHFYNLCYCLLYGIVKNKRFINNALFYEYISKNSVLAKMLQSIEAELLPKDSKPVNDVNALIQNIENDLDKLKKIIQKTY